MAAAPDFGSAATAQEMCVALAEPGASPVLTRDIDCWLVPGARGGAAYRESAGGLWKFDHWLAALARATNWAYVMLPAGDPVRAGIPEAHRLLRQRLAYPGLLLDAGWAAYRKVTVEDFAERFGPKPYDNRIALEDTTFDDGLTVAAWRGTGNRLYFRPSVYGLDERTATLKATSDESKYTLAALDFLTGPRCAAIVERIASGGLADGAFEADPRAGVPDLVAEIASRRGLDSDAAALYLQLLALPQPTDAQLRIWNRSRPAQHKAAVAALLAHGLVIADKRAKAGRGVFLPGPWEKVGFGVHTRPVEAWKLALFEPLGVSGNAEWPGVPLPELFAAAWQRIQDGELPG